jgi:hypothetical protein
MFFCISITYEHKFEKMINQYLPWQLLSNEALTRGLAVSSTEMVRILLSESVFWRRGGAGCHQVAIIREHPPVISDSALWCLFLRLS